MSELSLSSLQGEIGASDQEYSISCHLKAQSYMPPIRKLHLKLAARRQLIKSQIERQLMKGTCYELQE
jgi:hypothetical protein